MLKAANLCNHRPNRLPNITAVTTMNSIVLNVLTCHTNMY